MTHVSYSELRQNLARYLDQVIESRVPIVVARQGGKGNVVMMAEEEFAGWQETVNLLRSPANAARLLRSIHAAHEEDGRDPALAPFLALLEADLARRPVEAVRPLTPALAARLEVLAGEMGEVDPDDPIESDVAL